MRFTSSSKLNIFYQNVRGLRTKCSELYNSILIQELDIILLTETFLQNDIFDSELCDGRYDVYRCDRNLNCSGKRSGGGVMVCIRKDLAAEINNKWSCDYIESLCITISSRKLHEAANLHLILIYIPPDNASLSQNLNVLAAMKKLLRLNRKDHYLLVGDFNLPCLEWILHYITL